MLYTPLPIHNPHKTDVFLANPSILPLSVTMQAMLK